MKIFSKILVCLGLVTICLTSVLAEEVKGFKPKLLRIKINDQVLFEGGKTNTIKVKVKDKKITIQYILQNVGEEPAKQKYRIFIHFCEGVKSPVSMGGNFWPNRNTMKWKKDYKFVQNDTIHIKDQRLGKELMVFIGMFIKGRLKLANEGVDKQSRLFVGKVTFE